MNSFYSEKELKTLGLKCVGKNVLISRKASIYGAENMEIDDNVRIDDFCVLSGKIKIGKFVHIAVYTCLFGANAGIIVSDYCAISSGCAFYAVSDDYTGEGMTGPQIPDKYKKVEEKPIFIGKHVITGAKTVILPGATIGEGCSFGAMSLVKNSFDAWGIYAGNPCKRIGSRNKKLLNIEKEFLLSEKDK